MSVVPVAWVPISDAPGVSGRESLNDQMSRYETTNAQYCQFLNAALATEDVVVDGSYVKGANGANPGDDFADKDYYRLDGVDHTYDGATNGGAARIVYSVDTETFSVDSGFENHPVTWVSWFGATAFCNYYGYRLPTEWEWQAVADDYDGSYVYGCGLEIDNSIVNYIVNYMGSTHPDGTAIVGSFGDPAGYGYIGYLTWRATCGSGQTVGTQAVTLTELCAVVAGTRAATTAPWLLETITIETTWLGG